MRRKIGANHAGGAFGVKIAGLGERTKVALRPVGAYKIRGIMGEWGRPFYFSIYIILLI